MFRMPQRGFTLIELLVVIAIIAVLAAILFPVFARAREKARQSTCQSNQRQIVAAVQMYAQDHEETLPSSVNFWQSLNLDAGVLVCPTAGKSTPNGYAANASVCDLALGKIPDPSKKAVVFDGFTDSKDTQNTSPVKNIATWISDFDLRHSGQMMVAFADGHVEVKDAMTAPAAKNPLIGTFPDRQLFYYNWNYNDNITHFGGTIVTVDGRKAEEIREPAGGGSQVDKNFQITSGTTGLGKRIMDFWNAPKGTYPEKLDIYWTYKIKCTSAMPPGGYSYDIDAWPSEYGNNGGWVNMLSFGYGAALQNTTEWKNSPTAGFTQISSPLRPYLKWTIVHDPKSPLFTSVQLNQGMTIRNFTGTQDIAISLTDVQCYENVQG